MQAHYFAAAQARQSQYTQTFSNEKAFYDFFQAGTGGFALAHWCGESAIEEKIKTDLNVTIRCLPFECKDQPGQCIFTNQPSPQLAVFAKAY